MTKADRIRELDAHGIFSTREIAEIIVKEFGGPCSDAYVRVCARQRANGCASTADLNLKTKLVREHGVTSLTHLRYRQDPEYRKRAIEDSVRRLRERYQNDPQWRAHRRAYARAYYYENHEQKLADQKAYRQRKKAERETANA
jgi:hypothetical protein